MLYAQNRSILKRLVGLVVLLMVFANLAKAAPSSEVLVLSDAVEIAKKAYGGKVVKADKVTLESGVAYRIRLVNNGHVKEVLVDAASGVLLHP
ncbi:PepSY domain-containing protein [Neptunomonas japonica]|uniref:PepSY domain-containing protein n=1 Tax=Neptunomonas japonica TaxID=417574 RepID=UPI00040CDD3E|nr:PepSY domain-containing protein [Neptunomonas japonica]